MSAEGVWKAFDAESIEDGIYWFLCQEPEMDVDQDDDGNLTGAPTGNTNTFVTLAEVELGCELDGVEYPVFHKVDGFDCKDIDYHAKIIAYAEVMPPEHPLLNGTEQQV